MPVDLDDEERAALINLLASAIESDLFPTSERVQRFRSILGKLRARMVPPLPNRTEPQSQ
jgi:hypothetical protein